MQVTIREVEKQSLRILEKQITDKVISTRIKVILALSEGYEAHDVARILLLDEDTVTKWKKKFQDRKYLSDWLERVYKGYQGKLTKIQLNEIRQYVKDKVVTDCKELVDYVKTQYGIRYSVSGVTKLLHKIGFVYKQTVLVPSKADRAKQEAFLNKYEELKKDLKKTEMILFGDGVHPTHNTQKLKCWIEKGTDKKVKSNTGRKRLNINGVLDIERMEVTTHFSETINAQTTMELFDKIQERYLDKTAIYVIVDNARYYKNKDVQAYLDDKKCKLKLIFLPPYSPNLNYIERLWKYLKKYIIGSKYREKFKEFEEDVNNFFENIGEYESELKRFIGTKVHLIEA